MDAAARNLHGSGPRAVPVTLTLPAEHELLLAEVAARAEAVLLEADAGRWPRWELRAFLDYLHLEVLRHIVDEEWLLFRARHDASEGLRRLREDHLGLRAVIDQLADTAAEGDDSSAEQLSRITRQLVARLKTHIGAEEELLAEEGMPPSTASLGSRPHSWFALTEGPVINLDDLPGPLGVDATLGRLLRLKDGEQVELRASTDPGPVWGRLANHDPGGFGFSYLARGPNQWRVQITRRPAS